VSRVEPPQTILLSSDFDNKSDPDDHSYSGDQEESSDRSVAVDPDYPYDHSQ